MILDQTIGLMSRANAIAENGNTGVKSAMNLMIYSLIAFGLSPLETLITARRLISIVHDELQELTEEDLQKLKEELLRK